MTDLSPFKYKRVILSFMAILLFFLIIADILIVANQRKHILHEIQNHMQYEMDLIGTFVREPLLLHDYAKVEQFLLQWAREHDDVVEVKAIMPNGFILAQYNHPAPSPHVYFLHKQVSYGGKDLINLNVGKDLSKVEAILGKLKLQLIAFSVALTGILGIATWRTFRKMALKPMESELALRTQAEKKLQTVKDQLEVTVGERTAEVRERNKSLLMEIAEREKSQGMLQEATKRAQNEKAKSDAIIAAIGDGISIQDTDFTVLYQNDIHIRMIGDHRGEACYRAYEKRESVCEGCPVAMTFQDGKIHTSRRSAPTPNGILHVEITASPLRDSSGEIIAGIEIARDITERKRAEEALLLSEEKFYKAFHSSPVFLSISTLEGGRYLDVNNAFLEASGYSREEMIGHTALELHIWADPDDRNTLTRQMEERGSVYNMETRLRMKNGEILDVLYSAELINIESESCLLSAKLDISERNKLASQLFQAQKMEAVGQLAGGVAHDFNNILTAIISNSYLLKNRIEDGDPSKDIVQKIIALSHNAAKTVQELLLFSRKQKTEKAAVHLNTVIKETESLIADFVGGNIKIQLKLANQELSIIADRHQLEQVFINLATNARDAMPEGGHLTIETELIEINNDFIKKHGFGRPGMFACMTFHDTGTGIDKDACSKIFEPFFTTKGVGKGTGLGLSMVYGIIKQHKGFLSVTSERGKGTTFHIYLPKSESPVSVQGK